MRKPAARLPRGTLSERGYDKAYFRARALYMKDNPWCEMCARKGVWTKAQHCDHIETIRARPDLRLDPRNFQSLCEAHHNLLTQVFDSGDMRGACDEDGLPLDPRHPWAQETAGAAMETVNTPFTKTAAPPGLAAKLKRRAVRGR